MPPTITEVLNNKDQYPPELVAIAKPFYESMLNYTGQAVAEVVALVQGMDPLTIDASEAKAVFAEIIDLKADVAKRAAAAFAIAAADYAGPTPPSPPPAPPPAPPAGDSPAPTT